MSETERLSTEDAFLMFLTLCESGLPIPPDKTLTNLARWWAGHEQGRNGDRPPELQSASHSNGKSYSRKWNKTFENKAWAVLQVLGLRRLALPEILVNGYVLCFEPGGDYGPFRAGTQVRVDEAKKALGLKTQRQLMVHLSKLLLRLLTEDKKRRIGDLKVLQHEPNLESRAEELERILELESFFAGCLKALE